MWKPGDKVCALVHGGGYAEYLRDAGSAGTADAQGPLGAAKPRRCRKPSSPSGRTSTTARGSRPANRCWCRAAAPASASPRSRWRTAMGNRVFATAGSDEKVRRLREARRGKGDQLQDAGLRRRDQGRDRRQGRQRDPRHGRRRLRAARTEVPRRRRPPRLHRLAGRREDRDRHLRSACAAASSSPARRCGRARSSSRARSRAACARKSGR